MQIVVQKSPLLRWAHLERIRFMSFMGKKNTYLKNGFKSRSLLSVTCGSVIVQAVTVVCQTATNCTPLPRPSETRWPCCVRMWDLSMSSLRSWRHWTSSCRPPPPGNWTSSTWDGNYCRYLKDSSFLDKPEEHYKTTALLSAGENKKWNLSMCLNQAAQPRPHWVLGKKM